MAQQQINPYKLQAQINRINENIRLGKCKNPFAAENKKKTLQRTLRAYYQTQYESR